MPHAVRALLPFVLGILPAAHGGSHDADDRSEAPDPVVGLSTTSLDFGYVLLGTAGVPRTEVVTNLGQAPLSITRIEFDGEDVDDFSFASSFALPATVAPGASFSVALSFAPLSPWRPGTRRAVGAGTVDLTGGSTCLQRFRPIRIGAFCPTGSSLRGWRRILQGLYPPASAAPPPLF